MIGAISLHYKMLHLNHFNLHKNDLKVLIHEQSLFSMWKISQIRFSKILLLPTLSLSQTTNKLKEFADDNFKFNKNGRKLSKQIENTAGKGEIARYEQFLLFPVFSNVLYSRHVKTWACLGKVNNH